jgi:hypothetical protein
MKLTNKIRFLLSAAMLFLSTNIGAQTKTISEIIDSLRNKSIDTLIRRHIDYNGPFYGEKHEYIIWQESANVKILDYSMDNSGENPHYNFKTAGKDSIFSYLNDSLKSILKDHIFPFITKIPSGDTFYYTSLNSNHPSILNLNVECKTGIIFIFSEDIDTIKREKIGLINLNYPYNSKTSLFKLIESVEKLRLE